jgi:hypothetical protein
MKVEDLKVGEGSEVTGPCLPVTNYVITDMEGKEVERSTEPYVWIPNEFMAPNTSFDSVQVGVMGMKVGGKRRLTIPKEMNGAPAQFPVTRPQGVPIVIELELTGVRMIPGRR